MLKERKGKHIKSPMVEALKVLRTERLAQRDQEGMGDTVKIRSFGDFKSGSTLSVMHFCLFVSFLGGFGFVFWGFYPASLSYKTTERL